MDELPPILSQHKELVITLIAGLFGVAAAYIKRGRPEGAAANKNPAGKWLLYSILSLLLGAGLLALENRKFNLDPNGEFSSENPGAILCLAGSMLVAVGVVWTFVNLGRLITAPSPRKDEPPSPVAQGSSRRR